MNDEQFDNCIIDLLHGCNLEYWASKLCEFRKNSKSACIKLPPKPYIATEEYCYLTSYEQGEIQGRCDMYKLIRELNE